MTNITFYRNIKRAAHSYSELYPESQQPDRRLFKILAKIWIEEDTNRDKVSK